MTTTTLELKLADYVVPPQGGYTAKMLPCRVHNDQLLDPTLAEPDSEAAKRRMTAGVEYETQVGEALKTALKAVVIDETTNLAKITNALIPACDRTPESKALRERLTIACMENGVQFIWNARLPADLENSRISEPDFLVRIGDKGQSRNGWAYAPGDVKHHKVMSGEAQGKSWKVSTFGKPTFEDAKSVSMVGTPQKVDSIQLAHYHRHLEHLGFAQSGDEVWGGIIGKGDKIIWRDLNATMYDRNSVSALEIYDREFSNRLDVIRRAKAIESDPTLEPLVTFEWQADCSECPWRTVCKDDLEAADHITLLHGMTPSRAKAHYKVGVTDYVELSNMDHRTAFLIDRGIDVEELMKKAASVEPSTPIHELLDGTAVAAAISVDVNTASDVKKLHAITARYSGTGAWHLPEMMDQARVVRAKEMHLRRGISKLDLPRADIELDVDMENSELIYLWGTRLTTRRKDLKLPNGYTPYCTFGENDVEGEAEAFRGLWARMMMLKNLATDFKATFKAYCYTMAENRCMESLAKKHAGKPGIPTLDEVKAFIKSEHWVDLHEVLIGQTLWPTETMTLKATAKWARFSWRESGANGDLSVVWYEAAVKGDEEAKQKLLDYNEDDVAATWHLREWLSSLTKKGANENRIKNVATLDARFDRKSPRRRKS